PDPMRVLRARGSVTTDAQHRDGEGAPQSAARGEHRGPHHVRRPHQAGRPGRRRGTPLLRGQGVAHGDPAQRQGLRGAGLQHDDHRLRPRFPRGDELSRREPRTRRARLTTIREGTTMTQPLRKKGGLGRGLASLIPTGPADGDSGPATLGPRMGDAAADVLIGGPAQEAAAMGAVYREIAPADIEANPRQPRQVFDEEALSELVHSIREFGLLQPIVVRAVKGTQSGARYQIVMGERRWRAAQEAGLATIPAIVRETGDDNLLRDALLE